MNIYVVAWPKIANIPNFRKFLEKYAKYLGWPKIDHFIYVVAVADVKTSLETS